MLEEYQVKKINKKIYGSLQEFRKKVEDYFASLNKSDDIKKEAKYILNNSVELIQEQSGAKIRINSHDYIRERLSGIFSNGKLGKNYFDSQEKLCELYKRGNQRYENKIPPGYKDRSKDRGNSPDFIYNELNYERKFGDLIIFESIIEIAKERKLETIIFVSDDEKEDWINYENQDGRKKLGARIELKNEIKVKAGVSEFFILNTSAFLEKANNVYKMKDGNKKLDNIRKSLETNKLLDDINTSSKKSTKTKNEEKNNLIIGNREIKK